MEKRKIALSSVLLLFFVSIIVLPQRVYAYDLAPSPVSLGLIELIVFGIVIVIICLIVFGALKSRKNKK